MGCLYLEIEDQPWLVDTVDRGLMEMGLLGRLTKKSQKNVFYSFFPIATVLEIFQQKIPKISLETFRLNYRLFIYRCKSVYWLSLVVSSLAVNGKTKTDGTFSLVIGISFFFAVL